MSHNFTVTILTRDPTTVKDVPSGVQVNKVDYSSTESLVDALRGHEVAVCTVGYASIPLQKVIIDACITAGVRRFIPSDFSGMSTDPRVSHLPTYVPMVQIQEYLKEKAKSNELEYTIFSIGAFIEFVLDYPVFMDCQNRKIELFDGGKHPFSATTIASIGKAVAKALQQPEATRNRNLFVHEVVLTQEKLLQLAKKHTGSKQWTEIRVSGEDEFVKANKRVEEEGIEDPYVLLPLVKACTLSGKFTAAYPEVDNELLGISMLSEKDLEDRVAAKFTEET